MKNINKKILGSVSSLVVISVISLLLFTFFPESFQFQNIGKTSVISSVKHASQATRKIARKIPSSKSCDLGIQEVVINKINTRQDNSYHAQVVIHNNGKTLSKADVEILINNEQVFPVSNIAGSLSLLSDKEYVIADIPLAFDLKYNMADIEFKLNIKNSIDVNDKNDIYTATIINDTSKIKDIFIDNVLENNKLSISFDNTTFPASLHEYQIHVANDIEVNDNFSKYHETNNNGSTYEYSIIPNNKDYIKFFNSVDVSENDAHYLNFNEGMVENSNYALFVKAINVNTNEAAFSDIIVFNKKTDITKEEFSKLFVDELDIKLPTINKKDVPVFSDLNTSDIAYYNIKAIYDLGLLDNELSNFFPNHYMTRGQAIQIVLDYLDINLATSDQIEIDDVMYNTSNYYYAATLLETDSNNTFSKYLNLDEPATINFVNYLINEYPQNN